MFSKFKQNLKKTKDALDVKINNIFVNKKDIEEIIDDIEETLILSDISVNTSIKICDNLRKNLKSEKDKSKENIISVLKNEMENILNNNDTYDNIDSKKVVLIVGVNGVGKTTSIAKITNLYKNKGKKVVLAAGDTFRAGAVEQLDIWAKRCDVPIIKGKDGQDPASVIYEGCSEYKKGDYDVLICDTAGRLHNKKNLMDELEKIKKTIVKNLGDITLEVFIVLDATTGNNALNQVKSFYEKTSLDGIILTKLDSTAKGGTVFSIVDELDIPIKYIGTGEGIDDISVFDSKSFVDSII